MTQRERRSFSLKLIEINRLKDKVFLLHCLLLSRSQQQYEYSNQSSSVYFLLDSWLNHAVEVA